MFFLEVYQKYWEGESIEDKHMGAVESHLILIERLHNNEPLSFKLTSQLLLKQQIRALLTWKGEGTGHRLAPKVYEHYARSTGNFNSTT